VVVRVWRARHGRWGRDAACAAAAPHGHVSAAEVVAT
jgi:hypothetical protein